MVQQLRIAECVVEGKAGNQVWARRASMRQVAKGGHCGRKSGGWASGEPCADAEETELASRGHGH